MYASSTDPVPLNVFGVDSYARLRESDARRNRTFQSVMWAASRYDCQGTIPVDAFPKFPLNLQYQVQRAANLLNKLGWGNLLNSSNVQRSVTSTGKSGAPKVSPLNPVDTNPRPKTEVPRQGPFDTPVWGDYQAAWPASCTPGTSLMNWLQSNPWIGLGALVAVMVGVGAVAESGVRRRRRAA